MVPGPTCARPSRPRVNLKCAGPAPGAVSEPPARTLSAVALAVMVTAGLLPAAQGGHAGDIEYENSWTIEVEERDRDFFVVDSNQNKSLLCYFRSLTVGLAGTWSATVYDGAGRPVVQDTAAWAEPGPVDGVQPIANLPTAFTGSWSIRVRATGFSPDVTVTVSWVDTVDECKHGDGPVQ